MAAHLAGCRSWEEEEKNIKKKQFVRTAYFTGSCAVSIEKRVYIEENQGFILSSSIIYP
jgi:hypothetical protein